MKVIAINGSARKDGNTDLMIRTVFRELEKEGIETECISLAGEMNRYGTGKA
jgi:multimeric flavodoxin WrbA